MKFRDFSENRVLEASDAYIQASLPVKAEELDPVLSSENVNFHYRKLHRSYLDRANSGDNTDFVVGGVELHNKFFEQLTVPKPSNCPIDRSLFLIEDRFGTFEDFMSVFEMTALSIEGSGWCYLSKKGEIKTIKNHENKQDVALIVDMWEHAYYLDYGPDKQKYVKNFWKIINWTIVNSRLA